MHSTIDPHIVNKEWLYTFTINPKNQIDNYDKNTYNSRPIDIIAIWCKFLEAHKPNSFNYLLWPESKNGRIHFHGVIQICDPLKFDIFVLPFLKDCCTYEIDFIANIDEWLVYCKKTNTLWKECFGDECPASFGRGVKDIRKLISVLQKHPCPPSLG